ncbi:hypothetical protein N7532_003963 [Penicillium argentinense]|uniref:Uncharacterized protein n=1 Tax=Penicillium argentinense TaxID=1131581 RepID=A0A9W9FNG4_9EURO|nr:uncharacterized protein N7532_003963 [Penicillium argentinense]KAJ5103434.1 hypothetical protein N7532_003963 [Penicillium argentinense]
MSSASSVFVQNLESYLTRIREIPGLLMRLPKKTRFEEVAHILNGIANDVQRTRSLSAPANAVPNITPSEVCMANNIVSTLRAQALILQAGEDNGYGVTAALEGLLDGIKEIRASECISSLLSPGRFHID